MILLLLTLRVNDEVIFKENNREYCININFFVDISLKSKYKVYIGIYQLGK